ncbi:MAG TPA: OmpA family protein, partial [Bacteroidales bacterium]|nr:OmpA family protein [Bacteroidales bacterium]
SERQENGKFTYGTPLPEPFNQSKNEGGPTITVDNKYMVFTKCANTLINIDQVYYNCDLYYSEYVDGYWGPITNLGKNINRDDTWESQASISPDGQVLFFVSDRPGGIGVGEYDTIRTYDIYYSTRDANGNWRVAQNIGKPINTEESEKTPYIHSDKKTLYFSSTGHPGLGGYDIFISRLGENGKWSKPVNIGHPINSENDDVGLFVNTLGNKAYFSTNRYSGNYDIYEFDLYKEAQPNKVVLVKGNLDFDKENAADIKIQLQNVDSKKIQDINVDENTGKYAFIISETESDYLLSAKQEGAVYDLKYIAAKHLIDEGSVELKNVDMKLEAIEVGHSYQINDIYFATNSSELTEQSKNIIEILIDFMNDNPSIAIEIQGHTDNIGQRKDNMILSNERAKEVYNYIIERHIEPSRLTYKGYADTQPIATNDTEEGRALNRRTVFVILEK